MFMRKNKAFTLIELLAVIIIFAIIALIAVPTIMNIISKARKSSFKDSAYGIIRAGELYYTERLLDPIPLNKEKAFNFETDLSNILRVKGRLPESGKMLVNEKGEIALALIYDELYCIRKGYQDVEVTIDNDLETCVVAERMPSLALNGESTTYVEINTSYEDLGAIALSHNGTDITSEIVTVGNNINTSVLGSNTITYSITDEEKTVTLNRTVIVRDTTAPVLIIPENTIISASQTTFDVMEGVNATDNSGENITVVPSSNISFGIPGTYTITYRATDSSNNEAVRTRTVAIEYRKPAIVLNGDSTVYVEVNTPYTELGATAQTPQGVDLTSNIITTISGSGNTVNTSTVGNQYTITYSITNQGETSTTTRTVIVRDTTPPIISPKNNLFEYFVGDSVDLKTLFNVTYSVSGGNLSCNYNNLNELSEGNYTLTCTAIGNNGFNTSASTTLRIKANTYMPNTSYVVGQSVQYQDLNWKVISNSTNSVTLVLASNYTTGIYGTSTTFAGSSIYNTLNTNFVNNNAKLRQAIDNGTLVSQGTYNGNNYYVRIPTVSELSANISLSNTTNGSVFWTSSTNNSNLYLGSSNGLKTVGYFPDSTASTSDLYLLNTNLYFYHNSSWWGLSGYSTISNGTWWESLSSSDVLALPNQTQVSYYDSNSATQGTACSRIVNYKTEKCYSSWTVTGVAYWFYGPKNNHGTSGDWDNYILSSAPGVEVCYKNSDGIGTIDTVYYAPTFSYCLDSTRILSYSRGSESVPYAVDPVTYYKPTGEKKSSNIGYRPVITVLKR